MSVNVKTKGKEMFFVIVLTVQSKPYYYFPNAPLEIPTKMTTVQVSDYLSSF